jgi:hypothetical protein
MCTSRPVGWLVSSHFAGVAAGLTLATRREGRGSAPRVGVEPFSTDDLFPYGWEPDIALSLEASLALETIPVKAIDRTEPHPPLAQFQSDACHFASR